MRTVTVQRELFVPFMADAASMLRRHWAELSSHKDIPLAIDEATYRAVEMQGALRIYTARLDGELVGYAAFFLQWHAHYAESKQAMQDVLYVAPEHRGRLIGLRLIRHSERALRAEGVQVVRHHVKVAHAQLGDILEALGYSAEEITFSKRLDTLGGAARQARREQDEQCRPAEPSPIERVNVEDEDAERVDMARA